ncbi:MAG: S-adenosylmethionine decarboxylase [Candidatus Hadarchaeum sp.]
MVLIQNCFAQIRGVADEGALRDFLDDVILALDMTVIIPPIGVRLPIVSSKEYRDSRNRSVNPKDCGLTMMVGIAESHIALHTWPEFNLIYMEISSCKRFDVEKVKETIKKHFSGLFKIWEFERYLDKT